MTTAHRLFTLAVAALTASFGIALVYAAPYATYAVDASNMFVCFGCAFGVLGAAISLVAVASK